MAGQAKDTSSSPNPLVKFYEEAVIESEDRLRTVSRITHRCVCVWRGGGGGGGRGGGGGDGERLKHFYNFTLGPDATLNTEIHKNPVRIKAPNSVNASKRKHKKSNSSL